MLENTSEHSVYSNLVGTQYNLQVFKIKLAVIPITNVPTV